jgi:hypothetical protein
VHNILDFRVVQKQKLFTYILTGIKKKPTIFLIQKRCKCSILCGFLVFVFKRRAHLTGAAAVQVQAELHKLDARAKKVTVKSESVQNSSQGIVHKRARRRRRPASPIVAGPRAPPKNTLAFPFLPSQPRENE